MPAKVLEKALKDGAKESRCVFGAKEVASGIKDAKLIVLSKGPASDAAEAAAEAAGVTAVRFEGNSVALGKACGRQFRVSAVSFKDIPDAGVSSIVAESGAVNRQDQNASNGLNEEGQPPTEGTPAP